MNQVEDKMCEVTYSFNALVDSRTSHQNDLMFLKAKVADLEDRSCLNNLKIRGIPETVQTHQLPHFVRDLFKAAVPNLASGGSYHRQDPPHSFLPAEVPHDVLIRIHYFQAKEKKS